MSETIKDQETSSEQGNAGRRRLVRGTVAFVPLVLTLRSGAVAAASCTGVKVLNTLVPNSGDVSGSGAVPTDVCVTGLTQCETATGKVTTIRVAQGNYEIVGQNGHCNSFKNQQVAILSSNAAGSLGINQ